MEFIWWIQSLSTRCTDGKVTAHTSAQFQWFVDLIMSNFKCSIVFMIFVWALLGANDNRNKCLSLSHGHGVFTHVWNTLHKHCVKNIGEIFTTTKNGGGIFISTNRVANGNEKITLKTFHWEHLACFNVWRNNNITILNEMVLD